MGYFSSWMTHIVPLTFLISFTFSHFKGSLHKNSANNEGHFLPSCHDTFVSVFAWVQSVCYLQMHRGFGCLPPQSIVRNPCRPSGEYQASSNVRWTGILTLRKKVENNYSNGRPLLEQLILGRKYSENTHITHPDTSVWHRVILHGERGLRISGGGIVNVWCFSLIALLLSLRNRFSGQWRE